jgi:hypothetical protein
VSLKTTGQDGSSSATIAASTPYWESVLAFLMTGGGLAFVVAGVVRIWDADVFALVFLSVWSLGLTSVIVGRAVKHGRAARALASNVASADAAWRPFSRTWKQLRRHF